MLVSNLKIKLELSLLEFTQLFIIVKPLSHEGSIDPCWFFQLNNLLHHASPQVVGIDPHLANKTQHNH